MFHFRPINDSLMPFTPTYSPVRHAPATAGTQLATTCRYARYAEPLPPRPTANYSLLTANSSFTFSAIHGVPHLNYDFPHFISSNAFNITLSVLLTTG